ncbi:MAG: hypothetical protein PVH77_09440 [Phycisphaerales bacterium]|jgi:hypothetical protein
MKSENDIVKSELHEECKSATESPRREFGLSRILGNRPRGANSLFLNEIAAISEYTLGKTMAAAAGQRV